MDAKPQRLRAIRIHDENMLPPALPNKTLHQRTKSVPAFSTLQNGAAKTASAITAALVGNKKILGEVNPNAKVKQTAKDDLALGKKVDTQVFKPQVHILPTLPAPPVPKDVAHLSRPALRPHAAKSLSTLVVPSLTAKKSMKVLKDSIPEESVQQPSHATGTNITSVTTLDKPALDPQSAAAALELAVNIPLPPQDEEDKDASTDKVALAPLPVNEKKSVPRQESRLPAGFATEKEYIIYLEKQAKYFEKQNMGVLPPYATVVDAQIQPVYESEEYDYYDESYTARSFGLASESTGAFTTVILPKPSEQTKLEIDAAKRYVDSIRTLEDIDDETWDTSMVAEYGDEIFSYMRRLEARMLPDPRYMDIQQEIQWSMRSVLIDWVVQVHQRFALLPETLFLATNYIDRFLSHKVVSLGKLQLVGATALFIAAKFEEVNCPTLQEVIFMVDGGYTVDELLKAERFMLSMLQFDLGWPGPMSFLRRISKADDYDLETRTLAKYFLEVTIMDERFIGCTPSYLAAGAHCLARLMLHKGEWTFAHVAYSEYTYAQLRPLLLGITECCEVPRRHHASVYDKYTDKRYKRASAFVETEMMKGFSLRSRPSLRSSFGVQQAALTQFS